MFDKHTLLKGWHDQTQSELAFARSMRDQWQREVDRLEGKMPSLCLRADPSVPENEFRAVHPDGRVERFVIVDDN
ncbi:hypothetical protein K1718_10400 [Roseibium porphyridii]|uniref:Uncharacterized protein n=1 Tax=Roseibium porphyridii TaxID=2866279 RepID=A0ABY8FES2_9HYPH|nr:hypothetical protein [Roseibium sp. KMA01]WFE91745.1 hypothetical protein K1718_10400 [Roseibium sp. KMA01]